MLFDQRTKILLDLQRLTGEQSKTIYDLIKIGLIEHKEFDKLVNEMVKDRFKKGKAYIEFASKLNINSPEDQAHIVSRNYYGIYHLARATIFHTSRKDTGDDHGSLPKEFSQTVKIEESIAKSVGKKLAKWRDLRNTIDYSPCTPDDIVSICKESVIDAKEILAICKKYLEERGVEFEKS